MTNFSLQGLPLEKSNYLGRHHHSEIKDWADLNQIMEITLGKFAIHSRNITLRFDILPHIALQHENAETLCYLLLQTVLQIGDNSKLLLFIKSEDSINIDNLNAGHLKYYKLSFQTNFAYSNEWFQTNAELLNRCKNILSSFGGNLEINQKGTGCLFWVILPGKPS